MIIIQYIKQNYEVLDLLGRGGFACVYRARCLTTSQELAIKMVSMITLIIWHLHVSRGILQYVMFNNFSKINMQQ